MSYAIGSDHRGFQHKEYIKKVMTSYEWHDVGTDSDTRSDYPIFAHAVCKLIQEQKAGCGVLLCGTGVGMAIAANRYKGIYAAVAWNLEVAQYCKQHENVNVLVIPADYVSYEQAFDLIDMWNREQFLGGRYKKRLEMID